MTPYDRLDRLGLSLTPAAAPIANYVPFKRSGTLLYLSGQGPRQPDGRLLTGKVGRDLSTEDAYGHARLTGLNRPLRVHSPGCRG